MKRDSSNIKISLSEDGKGSCGIDAMGKFGGGMSTERNDRKLCSVKQNQSCLDDVAQGEFEKDFQRYDNQNGYISWCQHENVVDFQISEESQSGYDSIASESLK